MPSHWNIQWKFVIITSDTGQLTLKLSTRGLWVVLLTFLLLDTYPAPYLPFHFVSSCFSSSLFFKTPFGIKSPLLSVTQRGTLITFSVIPYTAFSLQQYFLNELSLSFIFSLSLCCAGGASPSYLGVVRGFFFLWGSGFKGMWGAPWGAADPGWAPNRLPAAQPAARGCLYWLCPVGTEHWYVFVPLPLIYLGFRSTPLMFVYLQCCRKLTSRPHCWIHMYLMKKFSLYFGLGYLISKYYSL